jgi:ABC-type sugar transport system ATPase subunit
MLRIEDSHKSFDGFKAVNGAHLTVEKGQLVAVIGPNGAGKTTLFNLITGQLQPDSGKILFNDDDISKLPPHVICRKGVARSFQIANVFHRLSVFRSCFSRPPDWPLMKPTVFWKVSVYWIKKWMWPVRCPTGTSVSWRSPSPWAMSRIC